MVSPFFITGYPRSMTAWVSIALNCAHERDGASFEEFMSQLESGSQIGNSDSTISFFYENISERFPNSKWVIIEREKSRSLDAFCRVSKLNKNSCVAFFDQLEACMLRIPSALRIDFNDVTSRIEDIWSWCKPETEIPKAFLSRMKLMNVQQIPELIQIAAKTV